MHRFSRLVPVMALLVAASACSRRPAPAAAPKPAGPPAPATAPGDSLFGPSGLQHPFALLAAAGALMLQGGFFAVLGVVLLLIPLNGLIAPGGPNLNRWRRFNGFTLMVAAGLAVVLTLGILIVRDADDPVSPPSRVDAGASPTPPADPTLKPLADPLAVDDVTPYMVPELRSVSSSSAVEEMPEPVVAKDLGLADVDVRLLDRAPRLANEAEAARALSISYARNSGDVGAADTALFWVRVEPAGGVGYWQMISATSWEMENAARTNVNYLRYEPGMKDGVAYPAWVVQRFVVGPSNPDLSSVQP